jgi:hypothetical protein
MSGEDCLASLGPGSGYAVNGDGTGLLTLHLAFSGSTCAKLSSSRIGKQNFDFVLERAAKVFDFAARDDFFRALLDSGDTQGSFTGSCTGQGQF